MRRAAIILLAMALLVAGCSEAPAAGFDSLFQTWTKRWFGLAVSWQWFRAQARAESALNPLAVSPVGARGLMQIMPATSRELAAKLGIPDTPLDARTAVAMGIYYDRTLWDMWAAPRPALDRLQLMFASYNAGAGHLLKAQRLAGARDDCDPARWQCIRARLPDVTGHHSKETLTYVERIQHYYRSGP